MKLSELIAALNEAKKQGDTALAGQLRKRVARNQARRDRERLMRDFGLVKVRGNLGGTYWE